MTPDFNKATVETLGKRAGYRCSNPMCRSATVGPNTNPQKATLIGEAAHIFGARPGSKRYVEHMSDIARADVTNGIWLCRNCHKLIDSDEHVHTADTLLSWREIHEQHVLSKLGSASGETELSIQQARLEPFKDYPPLIRRIVIDQSPGWEWRLTAELLRHLNTPLFRKLDDLHHGLYYKQGESVHDDEVLAWVRTRLGELKKLYKPIDGVLRRLSKSWGDPGESGDIAEIHHNSLLIRDYLDQVVLFEERIYFVSVTRDYETLVSLFRDLLGSQAAKLATIPDMLDEILALAQESSNDKEPTVVKKTITFDWPKGWQRKFERELNRLERLSENPDETSGFSTFLSICIVAFFVWLFFF